MTTEERVSMLLVERGVPGVRVIPLDQQVFMLGASPSADVFLDNSYVSLMHAQIVRETDRFIIRDLDSRNGTYVNGTRLGKEGHTLQSGDLIELAEGEVRLRFQSRGSTLSLRTGGLAEAGELFVDLKSRDVWVRGAKLEPGPCRARSSTSVACSTAARARPEARTTLQPPAGPSAQEETWATRR
jgi:pSer/pThr/pTyr-binding forkhead associated (FHA) protein